MFTQFDMQYKLR